MSRDMHGYMLTASTAAAASPAHVWPLCTHSVSLLQIINPFLESFTDVFCFDFVFVIVKTSMLHVVLNIYKCVFVVFDDIHHINAQSAHQD